VLEPTRKAPRDVRFRYELHPRGPAAGQLRQTPLPTQEGHLPLARRRLLPPHNPRHISAKRRPHDRGRLDRAVRRRKGQPRPRTYEPQTTFENMTVYGMAAAYAFTRALQATGRHPTRRAIIAAVNHGAVNFGGPELVALEYSAKKPQRIPGRTDRERRERPTRRLGPDLRDGRDGTGHRPPRRAVRAPECATGPYDHQQRDRLCCHCRSPLLQKR
jgi:hypothetical protein